MSKLEKLIAELCPDGVKYYTLNTVCNVYDGTHKTPKYTDSGIKFASVENIADPYATEKYISISDYEKYKIKPQRNDLLMTRIGSIGVCTVLESDEPLAYYVSLALLRPNNNELNSRYLKYAIESLHCRKELRKRTLVNAVPIKINMGNIGKITLPVPPLPVQREIVRILDNFTDLTEGLNRELAAELTARKKQYAYYRDKLLHNATTTVYKRLGDFCDLLSGFPFDSSKFKEDGIRLMRGMNIKRGYLDFAEENNRYWESTDGVEKYLLNDQDIVISMDGSLVGSSYGMVSKKDLPLLLVQRVTRIRTNQANIRYVYHYIASGRFTEYVHKKKTAGAIPHISLKDISNFEVPLPSLEIQKRLVEVLDNFDSICTDLNIGLPAEIEARQKQYEFYRDQLLTFAAQGETILTDRQTDRRV
jgi:type I restriction enzyme S subunit